jgi:hypothetical protein
MLAFGQSRVEASFGGWCLKIGVGAVLRSLADYLSPLQVGVGVPGGAEGIIPDWCSITATRMAF